jgi:hypothetical protein
LKATLTHPAPIERHPKEVWPRPCHFAKSIEGERLARLHDEDVAGARDRRRDRWVATVLLSEGGGHELDLDISRELGDGGSLDPAHERRAIPVPHAKVDHRQSRRWRESDEARSQERIVLKRTIHVPVTARQAANPANRLYGPWRGGSAHS